MHNFDKIPLWDNGMRSVHREHRSNYIFGGDIRVLCGRVGCSGNRLLGQRKDDLVLQDQSSDLEKGTGMLVLRFVGEIRQSRRRRRGL